MDRTYRESLTPHVEEAIYSVATSVADHLNVTTRSIISKLAADPPQFAVDPDLVLGSFYLAIASTMSPHVAYIPGNVFFAALRRVAAEPTRFP